MGPPSPKGWPQLFLRDPKTPDPDKSKDIGAFEPRDGMSPRAPVEPP